MRRAAVVLVIVAVGCRPQAVDTPMWRHYERAGIVQLAVLSGDLDQARSAARWIAEHPAHGVPGEPPAYADSMRLAAQAVAGAPDLAEAAMATARLGATCGSCHTAAGRGPRYVVAAEAPPRSMTDVAAQMTRHQWALGRMFDGLTGPSDTAWMRGAAALAGPSGYEQHIARRDVPAGVADSLARRLQTLALSTVTAGQAARTRILGELLGTCAGCHERHRVRLPQAPR